MWYWVEVNLYCIWDWGTFIVRVVKKEIEKLVL